MKALREQRLDVGICRPFDHDLGGLSSSVVWRGRYVAALPAGHRLACRKRLELRELADEPWILFARSTQPALYDRVIEACRDAGFTPRVVQQALQKPTVLALVRAALGISLVPSCLVDASPPGIHFCDLRGPLPPVELVAVWPASPPHPGRDTLLAML